MFYFPCSFSTCPTCLHVFLTLLVNKSIVFPNLLCYSFVGMSLSVVSWNILYVLHHHNIKDKRVLNLQMLTEIEFILKDISKKLAYLPEFWYDLKLLTHTLYAIYRLYYKILLIHGNSGMAQKCNYHNLIHGPHPISLNLHIFKYLCNFVDIQNELIKALVRMCKILKAMGQIALLLHWLIHFLDKITYLEAKNSSLFKGGVPVKYDFVEC